MADLLATTLSLGNYSRRFKDFLKHDIYVLGKNVGALVDREATREANMKVVLQTAPSLADDLEKLYFFKVYMFQNNKIHGYVGTNENPDPNDYPETVAHGPKCNIAKILAEINLISDNNEKERHTDELERNKPKPPPKPTLLMPNNGSTSDRTSILLETLVDNQVKFQNHTMTLLQQKSNNTKSKHYNAKLTFEPEKGIEQFLSLIESYCDANDISLDLAKVKVALAALDASDHGLTLKESLVGDEKVKWDLFKNKLISVLGKDNEYYDELFTKFRRGILSPGLALAKLTLYYKKSFPSYRAILNDDDERKILRVFIRCLDQPIQGLIKAEEYRLTLATVANRVQQLERAFSLNQNPIINSISQPVQSEQIFEKIMNLELERSNQAMKIEQERSQQQKQLLSTMNALVANMTVKEKFGDNKAVNNERKNRFSGLQNYCLHYIIGSCKYDKCKFIHADRLEVPKSVLETVERLRIYKSNR